MASKSQIINLTKRIEAMAAARTASQDPTTSLIYIPHGMDKDLLLAKHRQRWPVSPHARGPILLVWVSIGAAGDHDVWDDPAGEITPFNDGISWREVMREQNDGR
jgi:hypothetical protein